VAELAAARRSTREALCAGLGARSGLGTAPLLLSPEEKRRLTSPAAPIVLLRRRAPSDAAIRRKPWPGQPWLGVMLPRQPVARPCCCGTGRGAGRHQRQRPVNPLCADPERVERKLGDDRRMVFWCHNRPIRQPRRRTAWCSLAAGRPLRLRPRPRKAPTDARSLRRCLRQRADALAGCGRHGAQLKASLAIGSPGGRALARPQPGRPRQPRV